MALLVSSYRGRRVRLDILYIQCHVYTLSCNRHSMALLQDVALTCKQGIIELNCLNQIRYQNIAPFNWGKCYLLNVVKT